MADNAFVPTIGSEIDVDTPDEEPVAESDDTPEIEAPPEPEIPGADETVAVETEVTEAEPAQAEAPEPEAPEAEAPAAEEPEAPRLYADRFKEVEQLEQSYKDTQRWANEQSMARANAEREVAAIRAEMEQLKAAVQQQVFATNQQRASEDPEFAEQWAARQAQEQFQAQQAEQFAAQRAADMQDIQDRVTLQTFLASHPDADLTAIGNIAAQYQARGENWVMDSTPEALDVAYQLVKEPALQMVVDNMGLYPDAAGLAVAREVADDPQLQNYLRLNPQYLTEPEIGIPMARDFLSGTAASAAIQKGAKERTDAEKQARKDAFTTPGHAGAPVDSAADPDDYMAMAEQQARSGAGNVFIGNK